LPRPAKPVSRGNSVFQFMNDTITVPTNGSCVSTMVKIRAGSSGARLLQTSRRRTFTRGAGLIAGLCCAPCPVSSARGRDMVAISDLQCSSQWECAVAPGRCHRALGQLLRAVLLLVLVSDVLSQLLRLLQRGLDRGRARDGSGDL